MGSSRDLAQLHRLGIHTSTARNTPRLQAPVSDMGRRGNDGRAMDVSDAWHVYPVNDLTEHDTDTDNCVCIPEQRAVKRDDGSMGWIAVHHSLDGRELRET